MAGAAVPAYWLVDLDGVLVREGTVIDGADRFLDALRASGRCLLVLTNNSIYTPRDLSARLATMGLEVPESELWTAALATARFVQTQRPNGTAFVLGETGLTTALHEVGYVMTDRDPDYVILGETRTYSFEAITKAVRLIAAGARFLAANPDPTGPSPEGILPATGSVAQLIRHATGRAPYFVGKPNPLMVREGLNKIQGHSEATVMVGDRMDTDVVAGIESGLETILVLSGVTKPGDVERFPYRPGRIVGSVADLVDEVSTAVLA